MKEKVIPWITDDLIINVFNSFKSKKSPATDKLKPIVYKHLNKEHIEFLMTVYKKIIITHFTPTICKEAKLIFIPKPGKPSYNSPKAWKPISLTNYPVKALEKICVWHSDTKIKQIPLHINQHGFRTDRSTETAISAV